MPESTSNIGDDINDLIGNPPSWMVRSGLLTLAIVMILIIVMSAFIKYPDKITSNGIMTSTTPPINIKAKVKGLVDSIYISNDKIVHSGDTIIYTKNQANPNDMSCLLKFINKFENEDSSDYTNLKLPENLILGDIQSVFSNFSLKFSDFILYKNDGRIGSQIKFLEQEILSLKSRIDILNENKKILAKERKLNNKKFSRSEILHQQGVLSDADFELANSDLLQFEKEAILTSDALLKSNIEKQRLLQQVYQLKVEREANLTERLFELQELISILKLKIKEWKMNYFVIAELEGKVLLNSNIVKYQMLEDGQNLGYIIPLNNVNNRFIKGELAPSGIGKIEKNSPAIIKVDGYPYKEFGTINSYVKSVSKIPFLNKNGDYSYELYFPLAADSIKTNYGYNVEFKPNSTVVVEIITEDKSLLYRLFNQLLNLMKN